MSEEIKPSEEAPASQVPAPPVKKRFGKVMQFDTTGDEERNAEVRKNLKAMGLTPVLVRKLLKGKENTGDYLRRTVAGKLQLIFWFNGMQDMEKARKVLMRILKDKNVPVKERIASGACLAQIAIASDRIGESFIKFADRCDLDGQKEPEQPSQSPVAVNFNFPPVVSAPRRINPNPLLDENGEAK